MAHWKLGIDGGSTLNCDLARQIEIVGTQGYDYLEVRDCDLAAYLKTHSIEDVNQAFQNQGVKPICMSAIELKILQPGESDKDIFEKTEWLLEMGAEIGCPLALAAHLPPTPGDLSRKQVIQRVCDDLLRVSDLAAKYEMNIPYEFLGSPQCPIFNIEDTMEVIEKVNRDNIGWLFDIYHFHLTDRNVSALAKAGNRKLMLVHLTDVKDLPMEQLYVPCSRRALPGQGISDTEGIVRTLHSIGYAGPFVIELYDAEYLTWKPEEIAAKARESALEVLKKFFSSPKV